MCGRDKTHLKFSGRKGNFLNGIGFDLANKYRALGVPTNVDIAFCRN